MKTLWISLFLTFVVNGYAGEFDHQHTLWNQLLKKVVSVNGPISKVNYKDIKKNPEFLNQYISQIEAISEKDFKSWKSEQQLSFLINAYNVYTIKFITDHYPIQSIKDLGGLFSSPWKKKRFKLFGQKVHLDHIEHDLIRKNFKEARIHFAVVCASKGCPALRDEAFTSKDLDSQLESSARLFLSDSTRNRYDPQKKELQLSKIFDWYEADFVKAYGSVQQFVIPRIKTAPQNLSPEAQKEVEIDHLDYDWSLNE